MFLENNRIISLLIAPINSAGLLDLIAAWRAIPMEKKKKKRVNQRTQVYKSHWQLSNIYKQLVKYYTTLFFQRAF